MEKYIWIYFSLFATTALFASALDEPYVVPNTAGCYPKCGNKAGSCPTYCGKEGYCCKKGNRNCPKALADLVTSGRFTCVRDPKGSSIATTKAPAGNEPYLVPNTVGCYPRCGNKAGSCPTYCGKGGYCCKKGNVNCPKPLADLSTSGSFQCVVDPLAPIPPTIDPTKTGPYLVLNSLGCYSKCGDKAGFCPTICGAGGYCCKKGDKACSKSLADVNTLNGYACVRVPTEPYLVPNTLGCYPKCGNKAGKCPDYCGGGGYCCKKDNINCPKALADLNTLSGFACILVPTEPYLVPNTVGCWPKCGNKAGSCPTACGEGGYCCNKRNTDCPKPLADLNPSTEYACVRVPPAPRKFATCKRQYSKKGCYLQTFVKNEKLLISDRDFKGIELDWSNYGKSIHSLACRCSDAAKANGYKFFSLRFWGECWGKSLSKLQELSLSVVSLKKTECANQSFKVCNDKDSFECVGKAWYDYLYHV